MKEKHYFRDMYGRSVEFGIGPFSLFPLQIVFDDKIYLCRLSSV